MPSECIFNIFVYFNQGLASEYGVHPHLIEGSDEAKMALLLAQVDVDHLRAERYRLSRSFTPSEWLAAQRYGGIIRYFEDAFAKHGAPLDPVFCLTPIVDGEPKIDRLIDPSPFRGDKVTAQDARGVLPDYLEHYVNGTEFQLTQLIDDDYFKAIRTLFSAELYVSCSKLLMSCIDTLAYVEYGNVAGNFSKWLDSYVDLSPHCLKADELWEFRNSVLHMTNLASRKVVAGKIGAVVPFVGNLSELPCVDRDGPKPFNLARLIASIAEGIGRWAESYNGDRDKLIKFIERYDTTISDTRIARFILQDGPAE